MSTPTSGDIVLGESFTVETGRARDGGSIHLGSGHAGSTTRPETIPAVDAFEVYTPTRYATADDPEGPSLTRGESSTEGYREVLSLTSAGFVFLNGELAGVVSPSALYTIACWYAACARDSGAALVPGETPRIRLLPGRGYMATDRGPAGKHGSVTLAGPDSVRLRVDPDGDFVDGEERPLDPNGVLTAFAAWVADLDAAMTP